VEPGPPKCWVFWSFSLQGLPCAAADDWDLCATFPGFCQGKGKLKILGVLGKRTGSVSSYWSSASREAARGLSSSLFPFPGARARARALIHSSWPIAHSTFRCPRKHVVRSTEYTRTWATQRFISFPDTKVLRWPSKSAAGESGGPSGRLEL